MKSVRLSESLKTKIINNIFESSKCAAKQKKLKEKQSALFITVRDFTLGRDKKNYLALPKKLQEIGSGITIANHPVESWLNIYGDQIPRPVTTVLWSDLPKTIQAKIIAFLKSKNEIKKEADELKTKARQVVYSCSSTKQLLEVMPDADKYIPENVLTTGTQLMVSKETVSELRKLAA